MNNSFAPYFCFLCLLFFSNLNSAVDKPATKNAPNDKVVYIYQDADISNHQESSFAIQRGIELAFSEINNSIAGYQVAFKYLDHRGNVVRSKRNFQAFIDDPNALAIYSGIHSPPLIKNRDFINENKALTLVPWAAGGPITRHPSPENWIFRLSIDDTQAGPVIVDYAMKTKQCKNPYLLLESTQWGDSNLASMSTALKEYDIEIPNVMRFDWNIQGQGARQILGNIIDRNGDCLLLVANAIESAVIVRELLLIDTDKPIAVISHWGITGGNFHERLPASERDDIDLNFIQSCYAFTNPEQSEFAKGVFSRLKTYSQGSIEKPADLKAAVGLIHAYDLTRLLIQAINQTGLIDDMKRNQNSLRLALENLTSPVQGLVKTYYKPFSSFNASSNFNAHEALVKKDYCMGKYGEHDEIILDKSILN